MNNFIEINNLQYYKEKVQVKKCSQILYCARSVKYRRISCQNYPQFITQERSSFTNLFF